MGNTPKARPVKQAGSPKTYKFADFQKQAAASRAEDPVRPEVPPFVIDDVKPPILITAPDTLERQMIIGDYIGSWKAGNWDLGMTMPLLRAFCGEQFPRVWMMVKDDPDPRVLYPLLEAMMEHFASVIDSAEEAGELPGGSGDSSN